MGPICSDLYCLEDGAICLDLLTLEDLTDIFRFIEP